MCYIIINIYLFCSVFRTVYKLEIGYSCVNFIKSIYGNKSSLVELSLVSCSNFYIVELFWLVTLMYSHCMCRVYGTCVALLYFVLAVVVPRLSVARGLCRGSRFDSRWGHVLFTLWLRVPKGTFGATNTERWITGIPNLPQTYPSKTPYTKKCMVYIPRL